jgi:hypothetical protein
MLCPMNDFGAREEMRLFEDSLRSAGFGFICDYWCL